MSAMSKTIADEVMNHLLRGVESTSPGVVYLGLHDNGGGVPAEPGETEALAFATELGYTSYERKVITFGAPTGSDKAILANDIAAVFDAVDPGEGPLDVTGFSIWTAQKGVDAGSSGTLLFQWAVDSVKAFADNDAPIIDVGDITLDLD